MVEAQQNPFFPLKIKYLIQVWGTETAYYVGIDDEEMVENLPVLFKAFLKYIMEY